MPWHYFDILAGNGHPLYWQLPAFIWIYIPSSVPSAVVALSGSTLVNGHTNRLTEQQTTVVWFLFCCAFPLRNEIFSHHQNIFINEFSYRAGCLGTYTQCFLNLAWPRLSIAGIYEGISQSFHPKIQKPPCGQGGRGLSTLPGQH